MSKTTNHSLLFMVSLALISCSSEYKSTSAMKSAQNLVQFVQTGDTILLHGLFTDSVENLMSIKGMLATRDDIIRSFGELQSIEGPKFTTDSTATMTFRYGDMSLVSSLEFNNDGKIRFLSIQPEPVESTGTGGADSSLTIISQFADFGTTFNADSNFVRLVTILSPT